LANEVGLVHHYACNDHDTGDHVEKAQRLVAVKEELESSHLLEELVSLVPVLADLSQLRLVHTPSHIQRLKGVAQGGGGWLNPDTVMSRGSFKAALAAVGGAIESVRAVLEGRVQRTFALIRPPGHHATADESLGFCLFNNVAIASRVAMASYGLERILIVDFDVHHGNGTQDAFYGERGVLYFSIHQYPWYPGTGYLNEIGEGEGQGYTVNVPLPPGSGDAEYLRSFEEVLIPVAERYRPQLIIASAGYDAHLADRLSMMRVSTGGYAAMVAILCQLADAFCGGRLAMVLEGGYALEALAQSVRVSLEVLMGRSVEEEAPLVGPSPQRRRPLVVEQVLQAVKETHGIG